MSKGKATVVTFLVLAERKNISCDEIHFKSAHPFLFYSILDYFFLGTYKWYIISQFLCNMVGDALNIISYQVCYRCIMFHH